MKRQHLAFALLDGITGAALVLAVQGLRENPDSIGHQAAIVGTTVAAGVFGTWSLLYAVTTAWYGARAYARLHGWTRAPRHYRTAARAATDAGVTAAAAAMADYNASLGRLQADEEAQRDVIDGYQATAEPDAADDTFVDDEVLPRWWAQVSEAAR
jgi:hypothetical protein